MSDMDLDKLERDLAEAELVADPMDMANKEAALLDQMPALIAELRRLQGQMEPCDTCRHRRTRCEGMRVQPWCEYLTQGHPFGASYVRCARVKGCRAHEPKVGA